VTGQRPARSGYETQATRLLEQECGDVAARQLDATRAIGYAILSLREQLADQFADLSDAVVAAAGQVGDLAVPVDRLADQAGPVIHAAAKGPGKSAVMHGYLHRFLRRHPRAVVSVIDLKGTPGADLPLWGPEFVLSGADLATVRQALQDAAAWRSMRSEGARCGDCGDGARCAEHARDERLAAGDTALLARLSGGDAS
jgi:hypothetical protein